MRNPPGADRSDRNSERVSDRTERPGDRSDRSERDRANVERFEKIRQTAKVPELPSNDVQRLWFATLRKEWNSLVVMPAHATGNAGLVGKALAQVASINKDSPIKVLSAEGSDLQSASRLIIDMTSHVAQGGIAIVVLDSVLANPAGIPIALAADAVLLVVQLHDATLEAARRTVEMIGESRFVGAVTLDLPR